MKVRPLRIIHTSTGRMPFWNQDRVRKPIPELKDVAIPIIPVRDECYMPVQELAPLRSPVPGHGLPRFQYWRYGPALTSIPTDQYVVSSHRLGDTLNVPLADQDVGRRHRRHRRRHHYGYYPTWDVPYYGDTIVPVYVEPEPKTMYQQLLNQFGQKKTDELVAKFGTIQAAYNNTILAGVSAQEKAKSKSAQLTTEEFIALKNQFSDVKIAAQALKDKVGVLQYIPLVGLKAVTDYCDLLMFNADQYSQQLTAKVNSDTLTIAWLSAVLDWANGAVADLHSIEQAGGIPFKVWSLFSSVVSAVFGVLTKLTATLANVIKRIGKVLNIVPSLMSAMPYIILGGIAITAFVVYKIATKTEFGREAQKSAVYLIPGLAKGKAMKDIVGARVGRRPRRLKRRKD